MDAWVTRPKIQNLRAGGFVVSHPSNRNTVRKMGHPSFGMGYSVMDELPVFGRPVGFSGSGWLKSGILPSR
jgi:hypothetical protein